MKIVARGVAALIPVLMAILLSTYLGTQLTGWTSAFILVYLPVVGSVVGLLFLLAGLGLCATGKFPSVTLLGAFLYGFYFAAAFSSTLVLLYA